MLPLSYLDEYLFSKFKERNGRTRNIYNRNITEFFSYFEKKKINITRIGAKDIKTFFLFKNLSISSQKQLISNVSTFCAFLKARGVKYQINLPLGYDIYVEKRQSKKPDRKILLKFLNEIKREDTKKYLIFILIIKGGLTSDDIIRLKLEDIKIDKDNILVKYRKSKSLIVKLHENDILAFSQYINSITYSPLRYLFFTKRGTALERSYIRNIYLKYQNKFDLNRFTTIDLSDTDLKSSREASNDAFEKTTSMHEEAEMGSKQPPAQPSIYDNLSNEKIMISKAILSTLKHESLVPFYWSKDDRIFHEMPVGISLDEYKIESKNDLVTIFNRLYDLALYLNNFGLSLLFTKDKIFINKKDSEIKVKLLIDLQPLYLSESCEDFIIGNLCGLESNTGLEYFGKSNIGIFEDLFLIKNILYAQCTNKKDFTLLGSGERDRSKRIISPVNRAKVKTPFDYIKIYNDNIYNQILAQYSEKSQNDIKILYSHLIEIEEFKELCYFKEIIPFVIAPSIKPLAWLCDLLRLANSNLFKNDSIKTASENISKIINCEYKFSLDLFKDLNHWLLWKHISELIFYLINERDIFIIIEDFAGLPSIDSKFLLYLLSNLKEKIKRNHNNLRMLITVDEKSHSLLKERFITLSSGYELHSISPCEKNGDTILSKLRKIDSNAYVLLEIISIYADEINFSTLFKLASLFLLNEKETMSAIVQLSKQGLIKKYFSNGLEIAPISRTLSCHLISRLDAKKKIEYGRLITKFMENKTSEHHFSLYHLERGNVVIPERLILKCVDEYLKVGGFDDAIILISKLVKNRRMADVKSLNIEMRMAYLLSQEGRYTESIELIQKLIDGRINALSRVKLVALLGQILLLQGKFKEASDLFSQNCKTINDINEPEAEADFSSLLLYNRSREIFAKIKARESKNLSGEISSILKLPTIPEDPISDPIYLAALHYFCTHKWKRALPLFKTVHAKYEKRCRKIISLGIIENIAITYYMMGNFENALDYYMQIEKIAQELGNPQIAATNFTNIAVLFQARGEILNTIKYYNLAILHLKKSDPSAVLFDTIVNLASFYLKYHILTKCANCLQDASRIASILNENLLFAKLSHLRAEIELTTYDPKSNVSSFENAITLFKKYGFLIDELSARIGLAESFIAQKLFDRADKEIKIVKKLINHPSCRELASYLVLTELKFIYQTEDSEEKINEILNEVNKLLVNDSEPEWNILYFAGMLKERVGRVDEALSDFKQARKIILKTASVLPDDLKEEYLDDDLKEELFVRISTGARIKRERVNLEIDIKDFVEEFGRAVTAERLISDFTGKIMKITDVKSCIFVKKDLSIDKRFVHGTDFMPDKDYISSSMRSNIVLTSKEKLADILYLPLSLYEAAYGVIVIAGLNLKGNILSFKNLVYLLSYELSKRIKSDQIDFSLYFGNRKKAGLIGNYDEIIGRSQAILSVLKLIDKIADSKISILITGETGTGKELIARAIHKRSGRARFPFVSENCSAIPESLLESILFGHRRGSFTGAIADKVGLFELANRGTIFLDEVADMSESMQKKLLRALEERKVRAIGSAKEVSVDIRVISATNKNLLREVKDGKFREDLYYRLNVFHIEIPPLRERREDIDDLVCYFAKDIKIERDVIEVLKKYDWPGNIRELHNEIERLKVLSEGRIITKDLITGDPKYNS